VFSLIKSNTFLVKLFVDEAHLEATYKWLAPTFLAIGSVITCLGLFLLSRKLRAIQGSPEANFSEQKKSKSSKSTCCSCIKFDEPLPYGASADWHEKRQKKNRQDRVLADSLSQPLLDPSHYSEESDIDT
jgi:hypothetical protein